jgi:hypothetical protein
MRCRAIANPSNSAAMKPRACLARSPRHANSDAHSREALADARARIKCVAPSRPDGLPPSLRLQRSNRGFRLRSLAEFGARPAGVASRGKSGLHVPRCERVSSISRREMDCFAALAMTGSAEGGTIFTCGVDGVCHQLANQALYATSIGGAAPLRQAAIGSARRFMAVTPCNLPPGGQKSRHVLPPPQRLRLRPARLSA